MTLRLWVILAALFVSALAGASGCATDSGSGGEPTSGPIATAQTQEPTATPTPEPPVAPTPVPTTAPIVERTETLNPEPTEAPTAEPTETPTAEPTEMPTPEPTAGSTPEPVATPAAEPATTPTPKPTASPTPAPRGQVQAEKLSIVEDLSDLNSRRSQPPYRLRQFYRERCEGRCCSGEASVVAGWLTDTGPKRILRARDTGRCRGGRRLPALPAVGS